MQAGFSESATQVDGACHQAQHADHRFVFSSALMSLSPDSRAPTGIALVTPIAWESVVEYEASGFDTHILLSPVGS